MSLDLNTYLAQAQAAGEVVTRDSAFTLSADEARRKLRDFQLLKPELYVVHLVAAAVALGAERFRVETASDHTEFTFDGRIPEAHELEALFSSLTTSGGELWQRELAIGLNGARAFQPEYVEVATYHQGGHLLRLLEEETESGPLAEPWRPFARGTRIVVQLGFQFNRVFNLLGYTPPELEVLLGMCRYAPLELSVNGRNVSQLVSLVRGSSSRSLALFHLRPSQPRAGTRLRLAKPYLPDHSDCLVYEEQKEVSFSAALACDSKPVKRPLILVLNGVSFSRPAEALGFTTIYGVVAAPFLKKNLSHTDLVEDASYEALMQALQEASRQMLRLRFGREASLLSYRNFRAFEEHGSAFFELPEVQEGRERHRLFFHGARSEVFQSGLERAHHDQDVLEELFDSQYRLMTAAWKDSDEPGNPYLERLQQVAAVGPAGTPEEAEVIRLACAFHQRPSPFQKASCLDPWSPLRDSLILRLEKQYEKAQEFLTKSSVPGWTAYLLAELMVTVNHRGALTKFEQAYEEQPDWPFISDAIASLYERERRPREAFSWRLRALKSRSQDCRALWLQSVARLAAAGGSMSDWAHYSVRAGWSRWHDLTETTVEDIRKVFESEPANRLSRISRTLLERIETYPRNSAHSRFFFHFGLAALRRAGAHSQAEYFLGRRLLRCCVDLSGDRAELTQPDPFWL